MNWHGWSVVGLVVACGCAPAEAKSNDTAAAAPEQTAVGRARTPVADARTQYDLLVDVVEARGAASGERGVALEQVRRAWKGRIYTWQVAMSPTLCRPGLCVALPFDHARDPAHPILQGWLPRIELESADREDLLSQCAGALTCVFTMVGTLRDFKLSLDEPTSLTFSSVSVRDVRPARATESWIVRAKPRRRADPTTSAHRTPRDGGHERR